MVPVGNPQFIKLSLYLFCRLEFLETKLRFLGHAFGIVKELIVSGSNRSKNLFFQCKLIRSNHSSVLYFLLLVMFLVYDHIPALSNKACIFN